MRKWPWSHRKQHHNAEHWDVEPGNIHCWNCGEWCREKEPCLCCMKARWKARAKPAEKEIKRLRRDNAVMVEAIRKLRVSDQKKDDAIQRVREACATESVRMHSPVFAVSRMTVDTDQVLRALDGGDDA